MQKLWQNFDRVNLLQHFPGHKKRLPQHTKDAGYTKHESLGDNFCLQEAKQSASLVQLSQYKVAVLLGINVARAFCVPSPSLFKSVERDGCILLVFPHPSGVSHFWNSAERIALASEELQRHMRNISIVLAKERGMCVETETET